VSIEAAVSARLAERLGSNHWIVEVGWSINCKGVGAQGASYSGDRTLVDIDTGERIYLGGVTSAAGTTRQPISARDRDRRLRPELRANCGDRGALSHGSETVLVAGGLVVIPGRLEQG
jgi:hypothetical protein